MWSGSTVVHSIVEILFSTEWKISGPKERYLKFEAYWDQLCSREVTGESSMTVEFDISPAFFDLETEEQEEKLQDFVRGISPDLHPQIILLI